MTRGHNDHHMGGDQVTPEIKEIVKELEAKMGCNCDLDRWEPEHDTKHSWVCRIHIAAKERIKRQ